MENIRVWDQSLLLCWWWRHETLNFNTLLMRISVLELFLYLKVLTDVWHSVIITLLFILCERANTAAHCDVQLLGNARPLRQVQRVRASSAFIKIDPPRNSVSVQFAAEVWTFNLTPHYFMSSVMHGRWRCQTTDWTRLEWNTEDSCGSRSSAQTLKVSLKRLQPEMDLTAKYHLQRESFRCDPRRMSTFHQHHSKIQERAWSHFEGLGRVILAALNFHILFLGNAPHLPF